MNEGLLMLEAKDMAADKMATGDAELEVETEEEDDDVLLAEVKSLLDAWDDEEHEYYKDLSSLVDRFSEDEEEEVEEEVAEEW